MSGSTELLLKQIRKIVREEVEMAVEKIVNENANKVKSSMVTVLKEVLALKKKQQGAVNENSSKKSEQYRIADMLNVPKNTKNVKSNTKKPSSNGSLFDAKRDNMPSQIASILNETFDEIRSGKTDRVMGDNLGPMAMMADYGQYDDVAGYYQEDPSAYMSQGGNVDDGTIYMTSNNVPGATIHSMYSDDMHDDFDVDQNVNDLFGKDFKAILDKSMTIKRG